jgi:hypothetical protein
MTESKLDWFPGPWPEPVVKMAQTIKRQDILDLTDITPLPPREQGALLEKAGFDVRGIALAVFNAAASSREMETVYQYVEEGIAERLPRGLSWAAPYLRRWLQPVLQDAITRVLW